MVIIESETMGSKVDIKETVGGGDNELTNREVENHTGLTRHRQSLGVRIMGLYTHKICDMEYPRVEEQEK